MSHTHSWPKSPFLLLQPLFIPCTSCLCCLILRRNNSHPATYWAKVLSVCEPAGPSSPAAWMKRKSRQYIPAPGMCWISCPVWQDCMGYNHWHTGWYWCLMYIHTAAVICSIHVLEPRVLSSGSSLSAIFTPCGVVLPELWKAHGSSLFSWTRAG